MPKKALIWGISGQDGAFLARLLLKKGYVVIGTSRDAQISKFQNLASLGLLDRITLISANPSDFRSVLDVLTRTLPQEIYNLAGQSSVGLSFEQPVETFNSIAMANLTLLEAIRFLDGQNIRYYSAGSGECFGNICESVTEGAFFQPRSPYAVAKATAFWQVANYREAYGLYACSGILFNHESSLRPERFVTQKIVRTACRIARGSAEKLILGNLDIERDWGWAEEYVEAIWLMLQQDMPEDFIIATGFSCALKEFVEAVFKELGLNWHEHTITDPSLFRPTDINVSKANPSKAWERLKWRANYTWRDVIRLLVEAELLRLSVN